MGTCVSLIGHILDKFETTVRTGYRPGSSRRASSLEIEAAKQLILHGTAQHTATGA
jgi:hypothetical protein